MALQRAVYRPRDAEHTVLHTRVPSCLRCRKSPFQMVRELASRPGETMLEKHRLKTLSDAVSGGWKNVNVSKVNGLDVRLRVVTDKAANFHAHADSDDAGACGGLGWD